MRKPENFHLAILTLWGFTLVLILVCCGYSISHSAVNLTTVSFPVGQFEALAALILSACAALWVIRRLFGLTGIKPKHDITSAGNPLSPWVYAGVEAKRETKEKHYGNPYAFKRHMNWGKYSSAYDRHERRNYRKMNRRLTGGGNWNDSGQGQNRYNEPNGYKASNAEWKSASKYF